MQSQAIPVRVGTGSRIAGRVRFFTGMDIYLYGIEYFICILFKQKLLLKSYLSRLHELSFIKV